MDNVELGDPRLVREVYTIRQVTEMTGVSANTIRSWERRFGVPRPGRSGSNQRRYSERDVEVIRSIQASRDRGRTMDQALQDAAGPVIPVSVPAEPYRAEAGPAAHPPIDTERLLDALIALAGNKASKILADATWGSSIETVCVDLLLPAAHVLIERRAAGSITASQASYGQEWIHRKLTAAFEQSNPEVGRLELLVAAMHDADAHHEALSLAIVFSRAGYRVTWLGCDASVEGIVEAIAHRSPAAALLVARSDLSGIAMEATATRLVNARDAGEWQGIVAVVGGESSSRNDVLQLPLDADEAISRFEQALRGHDSTLRLMRKP